MIVLVIALLLTRSRLVAVARVNEHSRCGCAGSGLGWEAAIFYGACDHERHVSI
ncbi:hypothetical protein DFO68_10749 [Halomonas ventosae]|uniref:Uncharacterized protein n=1 Tax=Halomonas ventosae TaxID=229007 RepID=A0A4R6HK70_9GAMM|nr:hypothetical protein DFO68_10749 [Halomonas ventosae]